MKLKVTVTLQQVVLLVYAIGLALSTYMWHAHLTLKIMGCLTNGGCEIVLNSPYALLFGVPIAAWGFAYYGVGALIVVFRLLDDRPILRLTNWAMNSIGIFASIFFLYLEFAKIHALCSWCQISTLATIVLLGVTVYEISKRGGLQAIHSDIKTLYNKDNG